MVNYFVIVDNNLFAGPRRNKEPGGESSRGI
jgi:hypothetical protein